MNPKFSHRIFSSLLRVILFTGLFMGMAGNGWGQTNGDYQSVATGNWNSSSTWQVYNNGWVNASNYPGQAAGAGNVLIRNGHTVTINATIPNAIGSLTVGGGTSGILRFSGSGNYSLNVSGDVTVSNNGTFTVLNVTSPWNHSLTIGGNLTVNGTFNMNSLTDDYCAVVFNGASQQTISGTGTTCIFYGLTVSNSSSGGLILNRNIVLQVPPNIGTSGYNNPFITVSTNSVFDLSTYTCDRQTTPTGTGTVSLAAGATLRIGGTNTFPSNYNTHSINGTSTVEYYGGNQGVAALNSSQNYGNLVLSGSGTKTFGGARTITNNLSIASGVMANLGTYTHTAGTLTLGGFGTPAGSWGSTSSSATHKNDTYFAATSGIVNVGTGSCSLSVSVQRSHITCFNESDGSITITPGGGSGAYEYSTDNGSHWQGSNQFTGLGAGDYSIVVRDGYGCLSTNCTITP